MMDTAASSEILVHISLNSHIPEDGDLEIKTCFMSTWSACYQDAMVSSLNFKNWQLSHKIMNITTYYADISISRPIYIIHTQTPLCYIWGSRSLSSCDVTLLSASEECSTSTSSMPANSNSCLSNIPLNSSFLKMGLNWPVIVGYPVLKQQKFTKMAQKIIEYSRLLTLQLQWDWGGAQLPGASLKPLILYQCQ
jgi:hypothetical protein